MSPCATFVRHRIVKNHKERICCKRGNQESSIQETPLKGTTRKTNQKEDSKAKIIPGAAK